MKLIIPKWNAPANVKAFTSTRLGGFSSAPYESLNVGDHVEDDIQLVEKNRLALIEEVKRHFKIPDSVDFSPNWLKQEHTVVISTDADSQLDKACDAQFTRLKGNICTIMTADCMPVFICNRSGSEAALVHAGWRGFADGIVEKTISLFSCATKDILVHCGPAISKQHFEIGESVKQEIGGSDEYYFPVDKQGSTENKYLADLSGLLGERMHKIGVEYSDSKLCTYADEDLFFSYRRDGVTGRIVSMLWLEG